MIECFDSIVSFLQSVECNDYIIYGHFNSVLRGSERWGTNEYDSTSEELTNLVDSLHLQAMPLSGVLYSYFGTAQVVATSRLDRFLISNGFREWSTNCFQHAIMSNISNHIPIILLTGNLHSRLHPLRFFNIWCQDHNLRNLVMTI